MIIITIKIIRITKIIIIQYLSRVNLSVARTAINGGHVQFELEFRSVFVGEVRTRLHNSVFSPLLLKEMCGDKKGEFVI